jgi:hypothetical protein
MSPRLIPSPRSLYRPRLHPRLRWRSHLGLLCVAASLGGHGLLLALVMPTSPPSVPERAEVPMAEVAVAVLPRSTEVPPPAEVSPVEVPPVEVPPAASPPVASIPPVSVTVAPPAVAPTPPPAPAVAPEPESVAAVPAVAPEPEPPAPFANFPHLAGAQATCQGLAVCWRSPVTSSWRSAASDLQDRLEAQGYQLSNVTGEVLSIDSGVRVYAVRKAGEPQYFLNLISVSDGVLYTMTPEPMTTEQVLALQRS